MLAVATCCKSVYSFYVSTVDAKKEPRKSGAKFGHFGLGLNDDCAGTRPTSAMGANLLPLPQSKTPISDHRYRPVNRAHYAHGPLLLYEGKKSLPPLRSLPPKLKSSQAKLVRKLRIGRARKRMPQLVSTGCTRSSQAGGRVPPMFSLTKNRFLSYGKL